MNGLSESYFFSHSFGQLAVCAAVRDDRNPASEGALKAGASKIDITNHPKEPLWLPAMPTHSTAEGWNAAVGLIVLALEDAEWPSGQSS